MAGTSSEYTTSPAPRRAPRAPSPSPRTPRSLRVGGSTRTSTARSAATQQAPQYTSQTLPGLDVGTPGRHWPPPALPEPAGVTNPAIDTTPTPAWNSRRAQRPGVGTATATATGLGDPDVWLIAHLTPAGGVQSLEGAGRPGAIRVSRPYGHLRAIRPVLPTGSLGTAVASGPISSALSGRLAAMSAATAGATRGRKKTTKSAVATADGGPEPSPNSSALPAVRPAPAIVSAVEVETDTGIFRVERPDSVLGHSDLAWALANLEPGEPDNLVPLPRRQLALLLSLLPTPADPDHPEQDPVWGWAHRLRGPWERGPLHARGRLGKLIAIDPDPSGRGNHRACFELLGTEDVVWALGVPCFEKDSVYELVPLTKSGLSRFLSWPHSKSRARDAIERPDWEIARVVYRVGAPRWPLAGVVEPLGPMGIAG